MVFSFLLWVPSWLRKSSMTIKHRREGVGGAVHERGETREAKKKKREREPRRSQKIDVLGNARKKGGSEERIVAPTGKEGHDNSQDDMQDKP